MEQPPKRWHLRQLLGLSKISEVRRVGGAGWAGHFHYRKGESKILEAGGGWSRELPEQRRQELRADAGERHGAREHALHQPQFVEGPLG